MMWWNKINCGFSVEDETVHFGTRILAQSNYNVYEAKTLATIEPNEDNQKIIFPNNVTAYFNSKVGVCVSLDNSIIIFNAECNEKLANFDFNNKIKCFCVSENGCFILVLLENVELICLYLGTSKQHQFVKNLPDQNNALAGASTLNLIEGPDGVEIIVCSKTTMTRIKKLDWKAIREASESDQVENGQELFEKIEFSHIELPASCSQVKCTMVSTLISALIIFTHRTVLVITLEGDVMEYPLPAQDLIPVRVEELDRLKLLFCLTENGKFFVLCPYTFTILDKLNVEYVNNFTVFQSTLEPCVLLYSTNRLICLGAPEFEKKFDLILNSSVSFPTVNQNEDLDGYIFLEGFSENKGNRISVRIVEEVQPEFRFERLLRRGKFSEAEKFAEIFHLDLELVYKAKATHMLGALQPWTKTNAEPLENLIEMLDKIEDIKFTADCCINAITPELEMTRTLLTYSHSRLRKCKEDQQVSELHTRVAGVIMRLHTYCQLYNSSALSPEHWLEFSKANLLAESHRHLTKGEVREASLIWSRHRIQLENGLNPKIASSMYMDIPEWVSAINLLPWLCQFLPVILTTLPQLLPDFISWTLTRIRALELLDQVAWPMVGIQVTTEVHKIFRETMTSSIPPMTSRPAPLNLVEKFLSVLHSLNQLKCEHGIIMSYKEFTTDMQELVFTVLDRAPVDKVQGLVKSFLHQMLLEHRLNSDALLFLYIQRIVQRLPSWCVIQEGLWEVRVSAVLKCIYNTQEYLEGVLCIVKKAAVPWSQTVQSVVDTSLTLKHPLTSEIREQYALIPEKLILKKYGYSSYSWGFNEENTRRMILHIISKGQEEALQDALSLCRNTNLKEEVYFNFLFFFIRGGHVEKVDSLLKTLEKEVRDRIWYKLGLHLDNWYKQKDYLDRIKPFLPYISSIINSGYSMKCLKASSVLSSDYDLKIKASHLSIKNRRKEILDIVLHNISNKMSTKNIVHEVRRVSRVLELCPNIAFLHLIKLLLIQEKSDLAFKLLNLFASPGEEEEEELNEEICTGVLEIFVKCLSKDLESHQVITLITVVRMCIVESSSPWHLLSGAELIRWQGLLLDGTPRLKLSSQVHSSFISKRIFSFTRELAEDYITFGRAANSIPITKCFGGQQETTEIQFKALNRFHAELINLSKQLFDAGLGSLCLNYICMLYYAVISSFKYSSGELDGVWTECLDLNWWEGLMNQCISVHLRHLVNSRRFDLDLALCLLNFFQPESSLSWLSDQAKSSLSDINRQSSVLLVGMRYCELLHFTDHWNEFSMKHTLSTWSKCLAKLGIILRDPFGEEKVNAVQRLVKISQVDLPLLRDFCYDVRFSFQECIHIYAQHLLLSWEPVIEVSVDKVSGSRVLTVRNNANSVLKGLKCALSVVENEKRFVDYCANTIWQTVNCYYYEIFFVILDFLDYADKRKTARDKSNEQQFRLRHRIILSFLKLYTRVNPPSQEEKVALYKACPTGNDSLPPVADFRLPFTRLEAEPLTVISPELNLGTYKIWFKLMDILTTVNKNELCFRAIHKFCVENVTPAAKEMEGEWCIHLCNGTLMSEIEECIGYITDMEIVCASYYYVLNNLPPGADQVKAAELCHENAKKLFQQDKSEESRKKLLKVQKKFLKVLTIHVLHTHNLAQPEYVQLALSPQELISALYMDSSITSKDLLKRPDINIAVDKIGALHQVDINSIKKQLVSRWLLPDPAALDETIGSYFIPKENRIGLIEEDSNLVRACYILSYGNCQESFMYLTNIAFTHNLHNSNSVLHDVSWPISAQLRALQCLLSIAPVDVIYSLTNRNLDNIRMYMQELWFTCQLEQFGCVWSVDSFESCNKILLVEQLLEPLSAPAAKVAAQLCLSYQINHPIYWNTMIRFMIDNFMSQELKEVLPALENRWHLLDSDILSAAWNYVVMSNLSKSSESCKDTELKVKQSLDLMLKCPSPHLLDIKSFLEECKQLNITEIPDLNALNLFALY